MALAVTDYEALCSFQKVPRSLTPRRPSALARAGRPPQVNAILENCRACPELTELVGDDVVTALAAAADAAAPITPMLSSAPWPWARSANCADNSPSADRGKKSSKATTPTSAERATFSAEQTAERSALVVPALKRLFTALMNSDEVRVRTQVHPRPAPCRAAAACDPPRVAARRAHASDPIDRADAPSSCRRARREIARPVPA